MPSPSARRRPVSSPRVTRVLFAPSAYPQTLDDAAITRIRSVTRDVFAQPLPPVDTSLAAGHCP